MRFIGDKEIDSVVEFPWSDRNKKKLFLFYCMNRGFYLGSWQSLELESEALKARGIIGRYPTGSLTLSCLHILHVRARKKISTRSSARKRNFESIDEFL